MYLLHSLFLLLLLCSLTLSQYVVEETVEYVPDYYGGDYGGVPPPGYGGYGGYGYGNYGYGKPPGLVSSILYSLGLKKKR